MQHPNIITVTNHNECRYNNVHLQK